MSASVQPRKKNGQFGKISKKASSKKSKKPKLTKVVLPQNFGKINLTMDPISPKLKSYIDNRIRHQNDYILECLHIFLMDLEGALERDQLDWED